MMWVLGIFSCLGFALYVMSKIHDFVHTVDRLDRETAAMREAIKDGRVVIPLKMYKQSVVRKMQYYNAERVKRDLEMYQAYTVTIMKAEKQEEIWMLVEYEGPSNLSKYAMMENIECAVEPSLRAEYALNYRQPKESDYV